MQSTDIHAGRAVLCAGAACIALAAAGAAVAQQPAAGEPAQTAAEEVVITGSRIARYGFTAPTPVTVVGNERLEKLGIANIGEALAQLPSFRATNTPQSGNINSSTLTPVNAGARIADIRGLGPSRTLVLVDGRRFVPSTTLGTVDLSLVPTLLLDRSEVVTGGASAAYGSDAVSGVVNLILNKRLTGLRGNVQYGITDHGDGRNYALQLAGGTGFAGGAGHFVFGGEYEKSLGVGGCYTRAWCAREIADVTNPGSAMRPAHNIERDVHTSTATLGGVITATLRNGVATPARGGPLSGIQFAANGAPAAFTYGQNANAIFQVGGSGDGENTFLGTPLLSIPTERYNGFAHADYDLSDAVSGFVEGSYGYSAGFSRGPEVRDLGFPSPGNVLFRDNSFLPAAIRTTMALNGIDAVNIGKLGVDLGFANGTSERDTWRGAAGLNGRLGGTWKWDGYYQYGRTDYDQTVVNNRITANFRRAIDAVAGPGGTVVCRVNADASPANDDPACRPLNILGQGQFTPEAKAYSYGSAFQKTRFGQHVAAANVQGDLVDLWAGPLSIATGLEYRRDSLSTVADPISAVNGFYVFNSQNAAGRVEVKEGYVETTLPLLRDQPLAQSLELNGAARRTYYTDTASTGAQSKFSVTTWKVGAVYQPADGVLLRITESQDVRAPNATELFSAPVAGQQVINDIRTNNQAFARTLTGGNIALDPEKARTFTAGGTLRPPREWLGDLRLSVDYYDIKVRGAIDTLAPQVIVDRCNITNAAELCGLVQRNAAGLIDTVSVVFLNLNRVRARGVDIEASYRVLLARRNAIDLRLLATRTLELSTTDSTGSRIDRAGDNSQRGVPDWIVDGLATLSIGPVSLTAKGRYIARGKVDATLIGPEDRGYNSLSPLSINTNRVPSRFYTTFATNVDIYSQGNRRVQLFSVVSNAFNVDPPARFNGNANAIYYDPLGRAYRAGVRIVY